MSVDYLSTPVSQLVTDRPERFRVFEKWGIDYCCGGKGPLGEACAAQGLDADAVVADLAASDARVPEEAEGDWATATIPDLVENIVSTHHAYLQQALPELRKLSAQVVAAHAERHPELAEVREVLLGLAAELDSHLMKEEQILFPLCLQLSQASTLPESHCGTVQNPIRVMEFEHDSAGRALARLRELTADYTPPADACPTYRAFLQTLAELEVDLHRHIHKENHILFPRAIALESRLA